jgi:hypothetical protein
MLRTWFLAGLFSESAQESFSAKIRPCSIETLGGQQSSGENPTRDRAWS